MSKNNQRPLYHELEGHRVSLALADGSRIDDCELVSSGRLGAASLWLFVDGEDAFVARDNILEVWEHRTAGRSREGGRVA